MTLDAHRKAQVQLARLRGEPAPTAPGKRWTPLRKVELLQDIATGEITRQGAIDRHGVTEAELDRWERQWRDHGTRGLCVTKKTGLHA